MTSASMYMISSVNSEFCGFVELFGRGSALAISYIYLMSIMIIQFEGHEEDVNSVAFADDSSQIFYSASDDGLCKV